LAASHIITLYGLENDDVSGQSQSQSQSNFSTTSEAHHIEVDSVSMGDTSSVADVSQSQQTDPGL